LINGGNSRDRAGLVIEDFVCHMRRYPKPRYPGHAGPAQIMEAPAGHSGELIEPTLGISEVLEGLGSEQCEGKLSLLVSETQLYLCLPREVDDVRFGILCSCFRNRPNPLSQV
jgi:hypothetical protein